MRNETRLLSKNIHPFVQGGAVIGAILLFNLIGFLFSGNTQPGESTLAWEISLTLLLFFALANAVFFLNAKEKAKYWSYSISTFVVVAAVSIVVSTFISGFGVNDSGSIKWLYLLFSFSYLIFISIIGLMRRIVEIAIKQDKKLRGEQ